MRKPISIKINLLTHFLLLVGLVATVVIGLQYYFSIKLANSAAEENFRQIAEKTGLYVEQQSTQLQQILRITSSRRNLVSANLFDEQPIALNNLVSILKNNPSLYSAYIAHHTGNFFQLINPDLDPAIRKQYEASEQTRWIMVRIGDTGQGRIRQIDHLNDELGMIKSTSDASSYDPRKRPWYLLAKDKKEPVTTEVYRFSGIDSSGITFAQRLGDRSGVIAVDAAMKTLEKFLASQQSELIEETFLFDRYGYKYASSTGTSPYATLKLKADKIITDQLSAREKAFIDSNPVIYASNETDWAPMDFSVGGSAEGHNVDVLKLIGQKTGLEIKFINGFDWPGLVQLFKDRKIDILQSAYWTKERSGYATFSKPLSTLKFHLINGAEETFENLDELKGKTLAMQEGWKTTRYIKKHHPEIMVKTYPTIAGVILAVEEGEVDAALTTRISFVYHKKYFDLEKSRLGNWIEALNQGNGLDLFIMTHKNKPVLSSIIDKALENFSETEMQQLHDKWFSETGSRQPSLVNPLLAKASVHEKGTLVNYDNGNQQFFAYVYTLRDAFSLGHSIGIRSSVDVLMTPYLKQVEFSIYAAITIVLLSIALILYITSRIVQPINQLMIEKQKISQRKYSEVQPVQTYIKEFIDLSNSLLGMAMSIQTYEKQQEELMDSFIKLIAEAIDIKSPYTGGHCERVPDIAISLAKEASRCTTGSFADFHFTTDEEWREFRIGSWLHDCGKVTTPEYVVDKATKLETISNRIHEIRTRFEVLWRDAELEALKRRANGEDPAELEAWLEQAKQSLQDDFDFVAECNIGGEFMDDEKIERLQHISEKTWTRHFSDRIGLSVDELERYEGVTEPALPTEEKLLSDKPEHIVQRKHFDEEDYKKRGFKLDVPKYLYNRGELYNLSIRRGTLTEEERFKINDHVIQTIRMLENLPFPDHLKRVAEYAGTHHETLKGTGYPRKLAGDELSIPARIMAIADVFEALTACDRPYKKAKTLSEALRIMTFMVKDEHIDGELFELFLRSGVYKAYADRALLPEQIDEVDIDAMLPKQER